jgi:hypothetical protein
MDRALLRALAWPVGLAAAGAALVCWGLALGGYWPVAVALYGPRVLPAANAALAQGLLLAALGGALLAAAAASVAARRAARTGRPPAAGD